MGPHATGPGCDSLGPRQRSAVAAATAWRRCVGRRRDSGRAHVSHQRRGTPGGTSAARSSAHRRSRCHHARRLRVLGPTRAAGSGGTWEGTCGGGGGDAGSVQLPPIRTQSFGGALRPVAGRRGAAQRRPPAARLPWRRGSRGRLGTATCKPCGQACPTLVAALSSDRSRDARGRLPQRRACHGRCLPRMATLFRLPVTPQLGIAAGTCATLPPFSLAHGARLQLSQQRCRAAVRHREVDGNDLL